MVELDSTDLQILDILQTDASLSNQALAARLGISAATCLRRVKRLTQQGIIERVVAILSPDHLGQGLTAVMEVSLERQGAEHLAQFEALAVQRPEVQQCYQVSPGPDFVLIAQLPDMPAYHRMAQELLTQHANVRHVKAYFSVRRGKFNTRWSLPAAN